YANPSSSRADTVFDVSVTPAASPATAGKTHVVRGLNQLEPNHATATITVNFAFILLSSTRKSRSRSTGGSTIACVWRLVHKIAGLFKHDEYDVESRRWTPEPKHYGAGGGVGVLTPPRWGTSNSMALLGIYLAAKLLHIVVTSVDWSAVNWRIIPW
ncbi:MAG: hypothetical protein IH987_06575, partial [Planctomycetes bacterium]|nr:hypothetical protein [Planctomycetota bacterium]